MTIWNSTCNPCFSTFDQIIFVFHGLKTGFFCYSLKLNFICYPNRFFSYDYSLWDRGRHTFLRAKTNFNSSCQLSPLPRLRFISNHYYLHYKPWYLCFLFHFFSALEWSICQMFHIQCLENNMSQTIVVIYTYQNNIMKWQPSWIYDQHQHKYQLCIPMQVFFQHISF